MENFKKVDVRKSLKLIQFINNIRNSDKVRKYLKIVTKLDQNEEFITRCTSLKVKPYWIEVDSYF